MKKISYTFLFLFLSLPFVFAHNQDEQALQVSQIFTELSIKDLRSIVSYLNTPSNLHQCQLPSDKLLVLAQNILEEKIRQQNAGVYTHIDCSELTNYTKIYRTKRVAEILEKALGRKIYLNQEDAFVLSNATPVVYQDPTCRFQLSPYKTPPLDTCLKEGPLLEVFEESIKYPNYSALFWSPNHQEYVLYSIEYDTFFRESQLAELSDEQIIVLFGKLFPVSLQKPAWAWKIFGLTSIKREIANLLEQENKAHHKTTS